MLLILAAWVRATLTLLSNYKMKRIKRNLIYPSVGSVYNIVQHAESKTAKGLWQCLRQCTPLSRFWLVHLDTVMVMAVCVVVAPKEIQFAIETENVVN